MLIRLRLVIVIGWGLLWALPCDAELVLAVHPFKPATKLTEAFTPLCRYLSNQLGEPVTLKISKDYQSHVDAIGRDEVDIAYVGPAPYVKLHDIYGAKPLLARQMIGDNPVFHGVIFVQANSPIKTLQDLKGKRFAFGEPHSTMSHLVPRYMLWQAGVTVDDFAAHKFVGDHINVALGVLAGEFDAGAVKEDVFLSQEKRGLRAIATSEPISDHVFVASKKLSTEKLQKIRSLLLRLHTDPQGSAIMETMTPGVKAFVNVADSDYDSLRRVLKKMQDLGVAY